MMTAVEITIPTLRARRRTTRHIVVQIHKIVGLVLALFMAVIALSGSIIALQPEIRRLGWPNLVEPIRCCEMTKVDAAAAAAVGAVPHSTLRRVTLPGADDTVGVVVVQVRQSDGIDVDVHVGPDSGQVLGVITPRDPLRFIYDFHTSLLMGESGKLVLGAVAFAGFLLIGLGVYLWWPKWGYFKRALMLRWPPTWRGRFYALHTVGGAYVTPLALLSIITGIALVFPEQINAWLETDDVKPAVHEASRYDRMSQRPFDAAVAAVERKIQGAEVFRVIAPRSPSSVATLVFTRTPHWPAVGRSVATVDLASNQILSVTNPRSQGFAEKAIDYWAFQLHGELMLGTVGRVIASVAGLLFAMTALFGMGSWLSKRQRKAATKRSPGAA